MSCCADASELGRRLRVAAVLLAAVVAPALAQPLPSEFEAALQRARLPREAVAVLLVDAEAKAPPRISHRAKVPVNPASLMKLVTSYAALDTLGPAYTWSTPVYVEGAVREGTLYGNLIIKGQGDPKLVVERIWLLLRRVQGLGVRAIAGDIVLDRSAFEAAAQDPAEFDGEPLRPYNAAPDALLLNFKSVVMTFVPDLTTNTAQVSYAPPLAGVELPPSVALSHGNGNGACPDYRAALKADFSDPTRIRFAGVYPAACGEKAWPVAYAEPATYASRAIEGLWREMGGKLAGTVREGRVPAPGGLLPKPAFELGSPTLAEVLRDINKYSNNVMAQQLFLTLSLPPRGPAGLPSEPAASVSASREFLRAWWQARLGGDDAPLLDNGSGLSRQERISAGALGRLLQTAYQSPQMPELMASLPVTGIDGTLRRSGARLVGRAHLKTGSLRDVTGVAGYIHAQSGKRYVLVAIVNHAHANAARPALDALIDWAAQDK